MERNFKAVWEKALENLEAEEVKLIESHLSVIDIPAKQPIFSEGDDSDSIFIVRYGRVSLLYSTEEGNVYVKGFWSRGYVVGLISALLQERHNYHSEAIVDSSLFVFPRAALFECMRKIPQFSSPEIRCSAKRILITSIT